MEFEKYPHLERFGADEVDGINVGDVHVFPKIDGTNASVWFHPEGMRCGSRNRLLSIHDDNAGFMNWALAQENLGSFLSAHPHLRLFGEWLVPHSLKTYREDAWRKFYAFDVLDHQTGEFMHYDTYSELLKGYNIDFIPCMATGRNPTYEVLSGWRDRNTFLIENGQGVGEGVVIKQYGWRNRFGRTTWAKMITNTFKDEHVKEMGGAVIDTRLVEEEIADEFLTKHMVEKIVAKIRVEQEAFNARDIPRLLQTAYHDLVTEELWAAVKKHKNPKIDFKTLNHCTIARVKTLLPELFGK